MKKASSSTNIVDDLSSIFGGWFMCEYIFKIHWNFWVSTYRSSFCPFFLWFEAAPSSSGAFQEVEGESEERRKARLERQQRAQERAVCLTVFSLISF